MNILFKMGFHPPPTLVHPFSVSIKAVLKEINRQKRTIHGESKQGKRSPEFRAYSLAKNQCQNPKHPNYESFGGKGIKFLFTDFNEFIVEVGRKPDEKSVLSRIDRSGNYETGNICWTRNKNRQIKKATSVASSVQ